MISSLRIYNNSVLIRYYKTLVPIKRYQINISDFYKFLVLTPPRAALPSNHAHFYLKYHTILIIGGILTVE